MSSTPPPAVLPGEDGPIPFEPGRRITRDEALGVARRLSRRVLRAQGRTNLPGEEWPEPDELAMAAYRVPERTLYTARAKAEAEGTALTDVVRELLWSYGHSPMGSRAVWIGPDEVDRLRSKDR